MRADHRGRGHATTIVDEVERIIRGAYELGALSATDAAIGLYEARGWRRWEGPTAVLTPERQRAHAGGRRLGLASSRQPRRSDITAEIACDPARRRRVVRSRTVGGRA